MPTLLVAKAFNAEFNPSYIPVAVFPGGTSGVGQAMAENLARQTKGRAHIILIGRNEAAAEKILAHFPKPTDTDGWKHEFVSCDATSMEDIRTVCAGLLSRLPHINFLVISAGANSMTESSQTKEGLDYHLSLRYYSRYVWIKELLPLVVKARGNGQHARVMSVLGTGFGFKIRTDDMNLDRARSNTIGFLKGAMISVSALKAMAYSAGYNDAMVAVSPFSSRHHAAHTASLLSTNLNEQWFASKHPELAFTHIHPGLVKTAHFPDIWFGWLLAPLWWIFIRFAAWKAITPDECAQYMMYALLDGDKGLFLRSPLGEVISSHTFDPNSNSNFDDTSPAAHKTGVLNGVPMKGYSGSDVTVKALMEFTENITKARV
ncbi:hypothetical protein C8J57DRAFT_1141343 [Mycena rebaudengoi]|nr:hypothetical protein C8J57DRAFT_1141343 [Mycena rebaudengoi]